MLDSCSKLELMRNNNCNYIRSINFWHINARFKWTFIIVVNSHRDNRGFVVIIN